MHFKRGDICQIHHFRSGNKQKWLGPCRQSIEAEKSLAASYAQRCRSLQSLNGKIVSVPLKMPLIQSFPTSYFALHMLKKWMGQPSIKIRRTLEEVVATTPVWAGCQPASSDDNRVYMLRKAIWNIRDAAPLFSDSWPASMSAIWFNSDWNLGWLPKLMCQSSFQKHVASAKC